MMSMDGSFHRRGQACRPLLVGRDWRADHDLWILAGRAAYRYIRADGTANVGSHFGALPWNFISRPIYKKARPSRFRRPRRTPSGHKGSHPYGKEVLDT